MLIVVCWFLVVAVCRSEQAFARALWTVKQALGLRFLCQLMGLVSSLLL